MNLLTKTAKLVRFKPILSAAALPKSKVPSPAGRAEDQIEILAIIEELYRSDCGLRRSLLSLANPVTLSEDNWQLLRSKIVEQYGEQISERFQHGKVPLGFEGCSSLRCIGQDVFSLLMQVHEKRYDEKIEAATTSEGGLLKLFLDSYRNSESIAEKNLFGSVIVARLEQELQIPGETVEALIQRLSLVTRLTRGDQSIRNLN